MPKNPITGREVDKSTLRSLSDFITIYAPPHENPTKSYIEFVASELGVDPDAPLHELDTKPLADAMQKFEGFNLDDAKETLAERQNNPGNLMFARQRGAVPGQRGLAHFKDPDHGRAAFERQIELDKKRSKTNQDSGVEAKAAVAPKNPTRVSAGTNVDAPLVVSAAARVQKAFTENPDTKLTDQDKVELVALRLMDAMVRAQQDGRVPEGTDLWGTAVRVAQQGFEKKFGRLPEPNEAPVAEIGPRQGTPRELERRDRIEARKRSVSEQLEDRRAAAEKIVPAAALNAWEGAIMKGVGAVKAASTNPKPEQRALGPGTTTLARAAGGALIGGAKAVLRPDRKTKQAARDLVQEPVRAIGALALTTSFLIPMNVMGLLDERELEESVRKLGGTGGSRGVNRRGSDPAVAEPPASP